MCLAYNGIIPSRFWKHDPKIANIGGWTVALCLARSGVIPPQEWNHNPEY